MRTQWVRATTFKRSSWKFRKCVTIIRRGIPECGQTEDSLRGGPFAPLLRWWTDEGTINYYNESHQKRVRGSKYTLCRSLLLGFSNTFEYFFADYLEGSCSNWSSTGRSMGSLCTNEHELAGTVVVVDVRSISRLRIRCPQPPERVACFGRTHIIGNK
jgi:hypothetical protein